MQTVREDLGFIKWGLYRNSVGIGMGTQLKHSQLTVPGPPETQHALLFTPKIVVRRAYELATITTGGYVVTNPKMMGA